MSVVTMTDLLDEVSGQYDKYLELSQLQSLSDLANSVCVSSEAKIAPAGFALIGR